MPQQTIKFTIRQDGTVTEEVMGVDLVEHQLRIASGEELDQSLKKLRPTGHSIQCRINAEDPLNDFLPLHSMIIENYLPNKEIKNKVRFESFLQDKIHIPTQYDSLIAKLIVNGKNRKDAIHKTLKQLDKLRIEGFPTTQLFFKSLLREPSFVSGKHKTNYIDLYMSEIKEKMIQNK